MERTMGFNSTTAAVKAIIMEYVEASDKSVERKELVNCINDKMGYNDRLTDGVIAGAIKILINNGELVTVKRGCYAKGTGKVQSSAFEKIMGICERFGTDLDRACTVNLMDLTDGEKAIYPEFVAALINGKASVDVMNEELKKLLEQTKPAEVEVVDFIKDLEDAEDQKGEPTEEEMAEADKLLDEILDEMEADLAEDDSVGEASDTEVGEGLSETEEALVVEDATDAVETVDTVEVLVEDNAGVEITETETVEDATNGESVDAVQVDGSGEAVVEEAPAEDDTAEAVETETAAEENVTESAVDTAEATEDAVETGLVTGGETEGTKKGGRKRGRRK